MKKMDRVYLFCGCCTGDAKELAKVKKVKIRFTDYERFYEVMLTYTDRSGATKTTSVDLAYVWSNKGGKVQTIGELLSLKHDPCSRLGEVKWD